MRLRRWRARAHFWIQRQICRVRHDYEALEGRGRRVTLLCFHCGHTKVSMAAKVRPDVEGA